MAAARGQRNKCETQSHQPRVSKLAVSQLHVRSRCARLYSWKDQEPLQQVSDTALCAGNVALMEAARCCGARLLLFRSARRCEAGSGGPRDPLHEERGLGGMLYESQYAYRRAIVPSSLATPPCSSHSARSVVPPAVCTANVVDMAMCATLSPFRRPSPNFAVVVYRHQTTERPAGSRPAHPRMLVAAVHQSAAACPCHTVVSRRVGINLSHTLTPDCAVCSALATEGQGSRVWISRASEHL